MAKFKVACETGNVTFNPTSPTNQIILNGLIEITTGDIIEITHVPSNVTIYNRAAVGGIVTVVWDAPTQQNRITITPPSIVSSFNATDELRVYIDYPDKEIPQRVNNIQVGYWALTEMVSLPTSVSATYTNGFNVGGIGFSGMCRTVQGTVDLTDVNVWSNEDQIFSGVIDFWNQSPPNGTYNDFNQQINYGDQSYWLGCVPFLYTDFLKVGGTNSIARLTKHIPGSLKLQNLNSGSDIYFTVQVLAPTGSPQPKWNISDGLYIKFGWRQA